MNYNLDGICQDCIYLEKIKPLFEEKDKEIERLNNIIKELERTIYYRARYFRDVNEKSKVEICMDILDKLKELKGSMNK